MAKQLYDYWFVQFDFPNEEGKPYKSSGGKMVWNEKLKREKALYDGLKKAVNAVNEFFDEIDELIKSVPLSAKERAINAYKREIALAIKLN